MKTTLFMVALTVGAFSVMSESVNAELAVGDDVPTFEMVGSDGKTYTNAQFKGKKAVVIAWYPKAFTGG
jgi:peroxiredoxin Q/BCP